MTLNGPGLMLSMKRCDATTEALNAAAGTRVAVVVITGTRAGIQCRAGPHRDAGPHQRSRFRCWPARIPRSDRRAEPVPKPLCAVNGLGLGLSHHLPGFADLAFMSAQPKLKPARSPASVWHRSGVSSYLLPRLIGRNAAWLLIMSSEWVSLRALRMEVWCGGCASPSTCLRNPSARENACRQADFEPDCGEGIDGDPIRRGSPTRGHT